MESLLLPSNIAFESKEEPNSATVVITPCFHGYGTTLGNAYRRVLLSSLPGAAVEAFKIKGIQHEFDTVAGLKEDGVEIMLNLKQLSVKVFVDEPVVLHLKKKGPGLVTAGDFEMNSNAEIINKDLAIANLTLDKTLEIDVTVERGRGYKPAEEKDRKNYDLGAIVIDSAYSPIKDVGYHVEYTRVGDITDYEKLILNIETNGAITPREAIKQATQILMDHFNIIMQAACESGLEAETTTEQKVERGTETGAAVGNNGVPAEEKPKKRGRKKKS